MIRASEGETVKWVFVPNFSESAGFPAASTNIGNARVSGNETPDFEGFRMFNSWFFPQKCGYSINTVSPPYHFRPAVIPGWRVDGFLYIRKGRDKVTENAPLDSSPPRSPEGGRWLLGRYGKAPLSPPEGGRWQMARDGDWWGASPRRLVLILGR